jgi:hypothetical protein
MISIHLSNCQRTKYLHACDDFSLALSCPCMCVTSVINIIRKKEEEREMEKINVNNQMLSMNSYDICIYIPFEDWSFDDIVYTFVGSIVTDSFYLSLLCLEILYISDDRLKRKKNETKLLWSVSSQLLVTFLSLSFSFITHTDHLCMNDKSTSSSIRYKDASCSFRQYNQNEWAIICDWST